MARGRLGRTALGLRLFVLWWVSAADQSYASGTYGQAGPSQDSYVYACIGTECEELAGLTTDKTHIPAKCGCRSAIKTRQILDGMELKALDLKQTIWVCVECEHKPNRTADSAPNCDRGHLMKRFAK